MRPPVALPILLVAACTATAATAPDLTAKGFAKAVTPLFEDHCYSCHGEGEHKGDLALDKLALDFSTPEKLRTWIAEGQHGEMAWLARNAAKRGNPQQVLPGARSIVTLATAYSNDRPSKLENQPATFAGNCRGENVETDVRETRLDTRLSSYASLRDLINATPLASQCEERKNRATPIASEVVSPRRRGTAVVPAGRAHCGAGT